MTTAPLADSAFVVLALLAEGEAHGYELQRRVHERGFRFWTRLRRSSIYNALAVLEKAGLVSGRARPGEGPGKRVLRITRSGTTRLQSEAARHLSRPGHPRSEIDLGIYSLPFLAGSAGVTALRAGIAHLKAREGFLEERLEWCRAQGLRVPALAFERPLLALRAELGWLERVVQEIESGAQLESDDWSRYVYKDPPPGDRADEDDS